MLDSSTTQLAVKQTVTFYAREVPDAQKSQRSGHPVFSTEDFIRIEMPGEKDVRIFPASEHYKQRYPDEWRAYAEKRQPTPSGMPIAILFPQFPEIISTLEYHNVRTVEQLADLSDTAKQNIGLGAHEWQHKAVHFLKTAKDTAEFHKMQQELSMRDATIQKLETQITAMQVRMNELEAQKGNMPQTGADPTVAALQAQVAQMGEMMKSMMESAPKRGRPPKVKEQDNGDSN